MDRIPRVAIVCPAPASPGDSRFDPICEAFRSHGAHAELAPYRDEAADDVRRQLEHVGAALVWVNPIHDGRDRSVLDAMLRAVAASGVFVSAHPNTILKMGTKDVLFQTRDMPWSSGDIHRYQTADDLRQQFPARLAAGAPRVLKQNRGNGGNGVWRVDLADAAASHIPADPTVRVLHALRGSPEQRMPLSQFIAQCAPYFEHGGQMIDQPFQSPVPDGMVRCYMTHAAVVGFGHQYVTALLHPENGSEPPPPQPRLYYPPSQAEFQPLKARMEAEWIPHMQRLLDVPTDALPVIWDADFLYGPKTPSGEATYRLCEINVSSVHPFPDSALPSLVEATLRRVRGAG